MVVPEPLARRIELLMVHSVGCTATFTQAAGVAALEGPQVGPDRCRPPRHRPPTLISNPRFLSTMASPDAASDACQEPAWNLPATSSTRILRPCFLETHGILCREVSSNACQGLSAGRRGGDGGGVSTATGLRGRGMIDSQPSTDLASPPPPPRAWGITDNKHSTDLESSHPPRVCMSGGLLRTSTRPTLKLLLCLFFARLYEHVR
jgi:hypothetical protein